MKATKELICKTVALILVTAFSFSCVGLSLGNTIFGAIHSSAESAESSCPLSSNVFDLLSHNQVSFAGIVSSSSLLFLLLVLSSKREEESNWKTTYTQKKLNIKYRITRLFNYFVELFRKGLIHADVW